MEAALCASEQLSPLFSLCDLLSFFFFPAGTEMLNSLPLKPMGIFPLNAADPSWVEFCCWWGWLAAFACCVVGLWSNVTSADPASSHWLWWLSQIMQSNQQQVACPPVTSGLNMCSSCLAGWGCLLCPQVCTEPCCNFVLRWGSQGLI